MGYMPAEPLRPEDLHHFRWIDHPRLDALGSRVAYQLSWADADLQDYQGAVIVRDLGSGSELTLAGSGDRDRFPEWSPDSCQLTFSGRSDRLDQLYLADLTAGSSQRLTDLPFGVRQARWSPDGSRLAFLAPVLEDPGAVVPDSRPAPEEPRPPVARVIRRLDDKHDGHGFNDGRYVHLFVMGAKPEAAPEQLTSGHWSVESFDWSPDGRALACTGNAEPDADLGREAHLYRVGLDGSRRQLVGGTKASTCAWSPDGALIAFLAPLGEGAGRHERVWVVSAEGGEPRCLTAEFDRACDGGVLSDMRAGHEARLIWSWAANRMRFLASGPGCAEIWSVDLYGQTQREAAASGRAVYEFDSSGDDLLALCAMDPRSPGELSLCRGGAERRLTDCNPWLRERWLAEPKRLAFEAQEGSDLEGWLLQPREGTPQPCPLVLQIHGGPHAQYGWSFFHEFQVLAGAGLAVLYLNPRGSDGYGEAFKRAVVGDWAGRDALDLMAALDQALAAEPALDRNRLGVAGGSYGGYMTNWLIGQTPRFGAAIAMRSICNLVSDYAQSEIVAWHQQEVGSPPWPNPEALWRRSPIRSVNDIQTPLLLLHGEMDLRCPISQADEMFGALRLLGKRVELVRFPGESHDLSRSGRPDRRVERLRRITGWFQEHLQGAPRLLEAAAGPKERLPSDSGFEPRRR